MPARQPPEWAPHEAVWIGWPSHEELWLEDLGRARREVAGFARAVHAEGRGERVILVAANEEAEASAKAVGVDVMTATFGDVWLRDTGPIVVLGEHSRAARRFAFNGWGGKYNLKGDQTIGAILAGRANLALVTREWVLEGGAIDVDGSGLAVTTEQCLLNPNRNPELTKQAIERRLAVDLGIDRVLWLGDGLLNDHTDGHVDNLARFVGTNRLAIPTPAGPDDPNAAAFRTAEARAKRFGAEVVPVPSPGRVERDGEIVPASYMNFYIGNAAVVIPVWGADNDQAAVDAIGALFPDRDAVGIRSDHLLTGGGSFHCISQQLPTRDAMKAVGG